MAAVRFLRPYLPVIGAVFALSWALILVAWLLLPRSRDVPLVIPPGTGERITRGEPVAVLPDTLVLRRGDTLVVQNQDRVVHRIGPLVAPPGQTSTAQVTAAFFASSTLVCSFHPGGAIGVTPQSRPGLLASVLPTLLLGLPLSIATVITLAIAGRLDRAEAPGGR